MCLLNLIDLSCWCTKYTAWDFTRQVQNYETKTFFLPQIKVWFLNVNIDRINILYLLYVGVTCNILLNNALSNWQLTSNRPLKKVLQSGQIVIFQARDQCYRLSNSSISSDRSKCYLQSGQTVICQVIDLILWLWSCWQRFEVFLH